LAIYIAWGNKPLDVEEPVQLRLADELHIQAVAAMCCHQDLDYKRVSPNSRRWKVPGYLDGTEPRVCREEGNKEQLHIIITSQGPGSNWNIFNNESVPLKQLFWSTVLAIAPWGRQGRIR